MAVKSLVKLKPASNYIDALKDSFEIGGDVDPAKWGSRGFYDHVLDHGDQCEVATLTKEFGGTPFSDALVLSADAKENVNAVRIYFIGPADAKGCHHVVQRCLDVRKLHRLNHVSVFQQLDASMKAVRSAVASVGCFVADGFSVNGVQSNQLPTGDNVWGLLHSNNQLCLRWWAACHRENLALKDLWHDAQLSEFLGEVDAFLNSVAKCLDMSSPMQDELVFFANMVISSFKPGHSHSMEHAASRWNSRKPLICNVSNSYGAWLLYSRRHSKNANDPWTRHHAWLKKPTTYIRLKCLADVLEMYDRKGLIPNQEKDPLRAGATDVQMKKRELCAELEGYILARPPPAQHDGEPVDNSIVRRAFVEFRLEPGRWYIQRGLQDIGFARGVVYDNLELKLDGSPEGAAVKMGFEQTHFRDAYLWVKKFTQKLVANLDRRFQDEMVWEGLRTLTHPAVWRNVEIPTEPLGKIARHLGIPRAELEEAWANMRPKVFARLGLLPPGGELCRHDFRSSMLLPALAECPASTLRVLIVVAVATSGNSAQLERDMKTLRDLWGKRTKKICPVKLGKQMRLSLNYKERCAGRACDVSKEACIAADIKAIWDEWQSEKDGTHRGGLSGMRKRPRSDVDGEHKEQKRRFASHLTNADVENLTGHMRSAGQQVMKDQRDVNGGGGTIGADLLDGL